MKECKVVVESKSPEETKNIAMAFAKSLADGDIVLLSGDLGAGKTVFTKGFVLGRGVENAEVTSPTFTIMNDYGDGNVFHFDLYRLNSPDEFFATGAVEQLYTSAVSVVEWPEVVGMDFFPSSAYVVKIEKIDDKTRRICIKRNNG